MDSTILVMAHFAEAAERPARYAALLGAALPARLALLHLDMYPVMLEPELMAAAADQTARNEAEAMSELQALADELPVPTTVIEAAGVMANALEDALNDYKPLLVVMGLSQQHGLLDALLHNQVLPVLRAAHRPLLLVPTDVVLTANPPRRVLIAVDEEPFTLNAAARQLTPLLATWQAAYTLTHVLDPHADPARNSHSALTHLAASYLLPPEAPVWLYQESHPSPAAGVLQALTDTQAELLILIARPRSFLSRVFHHSVTAAVLNHSPVPVLLLPVEAAEIPAWMPSMS